MKEQSLQGDALPLLLLCTEILISVICVFHKRDIQSPLSSFVEDLSFKEFLLRWRRKQGGEGSKLWHDILWSRKCSLVHWKNRNGMCEVFRKCTDKHQQIKCARKKHIEALECLGHSSNFPQLLLWNVHRKTIKTCKSWSRWQTLLWSFISPPICSGDAWCPCMGAVMESVSLPTYYCLVQQVWVLLWPMLSHSVHLYAYI